MSNYRTHVNFNMFFAFPIAIAGVYYMYEPSIDLITTFSVAFCYGTYFMNPDLDLIHLVKPFSLRGILTLPFRFYSKIFKHRGLSHSIMFGTATRLLWIFAVAFLVFYLIYRVVPSEQTFLFYLSSYKLYLLYGLAGVVFADLCHIILDWQKIFK